METYPELPNFIRMLAEKFEHAAWAPFLLTWENVIFSVLAGAFLVGLAWYSSRNCQSIPGRIQGFFELYIETMSGFVCGILGPKGAPYVPFIGTLFIYILTLNLMGFIPFLKSPTTSLSTTVALSLCVFAYVQFTSFKELGVRGYMDHLMGKPRGVMAWTVIMPLFMFVLHTMSEFIRPLTLSLRLRSTLWGDDLLLAIFAGFGIKGLPFLFVNFILSLMTAFIQAFVFTILTTVYFALVLVHDEEGEGAH